MKPAWWPSTDNVKDPPRVSGSLAKEFQLLYLTPWLPRTGNLTLTDRVLLNLLFQQAYCCLFVCFATEDKHCLWLFIFILSTSWVLVALSARVTNISFRFIHPTLAIAKNMLREKIHLREEIERCEWTQSSLVTSLLIICILSLKSS